MAANSQTFVPVPKPTGIKPVDDEEAQIERGKQLFETRGCLACHEHQDFQKDVENDDDSVFPAAHRFRGENEIVQGPDLSRLPAKFDPQRNPKGREWLYSWIKEPTRYHARTVMPNLYLDPIAQKTADGKVEFTDPVDDIVAYLLDKEHLKSAGDWQPVAQATTKVDDEALRTLTIEYLRESFPERKLEDYYNSGIPESLRSTLKVAERDLIVPEGGQLSDEQRLRYIGRRTIAKYGCFGCHDIPGFEDAKPIGTGLADWGRKDPSKLAFEHITHYLEHGHGHAAHHAKDGHDDDKHEADHHAPAKASPDEELPVFYERAMHHQHRSAFIYQKLKEPRSYDYKKVDNKKYNDRLRMPQFPFTPEQREAVITFVLGLVADPPTEKYLYKPNPRQAAILAGKQVLETYNCGGCHILQGEKWKLSFAPDTFEEQSAAKTYPYMLHQFDPNMIAKSATPDARGNVSATIHGLPATVAANGLAMVLDEEDGELEADTPYAKKTVKLGFDLYAPTVLGGKPIPNRAATDSCAAAAVNARYATEGGFLTKYLLPIVTQRLAKTAGTGKVAKHSVGYHRR